MNLSHQKTIAKQKQGLKAISALCPVFGDQQRDENGQFVQIIKSYRIWCFWNDGSWTAETLKSFKHTSKIAKEIRRKINNGHQVYPWPEGDSSG